jgi:hypothetical protein
MFIGLFAPWSLGQGDKPQMKRRAEDVPDSKPPEAKKAKKGKGPRAVGVLQLNSAGKGALVPVAILIDGKFYDASAYKADPIPMALESGTVYEAEQGGDSQGLFTIDGALRSKSPGSAHPWVGSGTYLPQGAEAPKDKRKAENVPVGMDNNRDEPPRLTRKNSAKPAASDSGAGAQSGSGGGEKAGGTAPAAADKGGDAGAKQPAGAPTQTAPDKTSSAPGQTGSGQASSGSTTSGQTSSGQTSSGQTSSGQTSSGQTTSGKAAEDYYRPELRRGKPTQGAPPDEGSTVVRKDDKKGDAAIASSVDPSSADPSFVGSEPSRAMAAISDAAGPEPQSYKFFWKTGEEEEKRSQMMELAKNEVRTYAAALVKNQILAKPASTKPVAAGRKPTTKPVQPVLEKVQFRAFDPWLTNQPVIVMSAEAHFPAEQGAAPAVEPYSVTLVVKTDIYGNLRKLYSGVTDRFHLDVTPRMELIDVVDADGDGRGELLFRETSDAGDGYVIYRATADKLWKMFDSLNAE